MNGFEQFFGMVRNKKFCIFAPPHREGNLVRLTGIDVQESRPPESAEIDISEYEGKIIEVNGIDNGDWLYSARVVEEAGPVLSDFLKKVFCKDDEIGELCALVIGHKKDSPGAMNKKHNIGEFEFNERLAPMIESRVKNTRVQRVYRRAYAQLPADINALNPAFVVSLHCNANDGTASGSEVLYYHKSLKGMEIAAIMLGYLVSHLKFPNRGIKPKTSEEKGGYLLRYTSAPCIIAEPFFIDNDSDLVHVMADMEGLASAYALAIDEISKVLKARKFLAGL